MMTVPGSPFSFMRLTYIHQQFFHLFQGSKSDSDPFQCFLHAIQWTSWKKKLTVQYFLVYNSYQTEWSPIRETVLVHPTLQIYYHQLLIMLFCSSSVRSKIQLLYTWGSRLTHTAPVLWNSLSLSIKTCKSIAVFKH